MRILAIIGLIATTAQAVVAQDSSAVGQRADPLGQARPAWISRSDAKPVGVALFGIALSSLVDERVAQRFQQQARKENQFLNNSSSAVRLVGDPIALLMSASFFAVGAASHHSEIADAGRHATEAIIVGGAITQLLKISVGRARPVVTGDSDSHRFRAFHGTTKDYNSFPSGHTSASFAAAAVFSKELQRHHPRAARFATPAMYGVAGLVGASRMYDDRHWLSDVVTGAVIGTFVGRRMTSHAHGK